MAVCCISVQSKLNPPEIPMCALFYLFNAIVCIKSVGLSLESLTISRWDASWMHVHIVNKFTVCARVRRHTAVI